MTESQLEKLGALADSIDNVLLAAELPLPTKSHLEQMKESAKKWAAELKSIYVEESGDNPWERL